MLGMGASMSPGTTAHLSSPISVSKSGIAGGACPAIPASRGNSIVCLMSASTTKSWMTPREINTMTLKIIVMTLVTTALLLTGKAQDGTECCLLLEKYYLKCHPGCTIVELLHLLG